MKKLFGNLKRVLLSLRGIFFPMTDKITAGTGVAVRTLGGAIGAGAAFLVLLCILAVVAIAAIPYGAFAASTEPLTNCTENACERCGQVDIPLFRHDKEIVCGDCLRDSQNPPKPEPPNPPEPPETRKIKEGQSSATPKGN